MNCPRCPRSLTPIKVGGVTVDVCQNGCGGIWFDLFELEKMDEPDEAAGALLDGMRVDLGAEVDLAKPVKCPRCEGVTLMRQKHPSNPDVMTDKCQVCGGVWLDYGELFEVRSGDSADKRPHISGLLSGFRA